jgi:hypothetical protein
LPRGGFKRVPEHTGLLCVERLEGQYICQLQILITQARKNTKKGQEKKKEKLKKFFRPSYEQNLVRF